MGGTFSADVARFVRQANLKVDQVVSGVVFSLGSKMIDATPVLTGRARGNWLVSMDGLKKDKTAAFDKSGALSKNRLAVSLDGFSTRKTKMIWFTNTLEYIIPLEYGHSAKSPEGMVRATLSNFRGIVAEELRK